MDTYHREITGKSNIVYNYVFTFELMDIKDNWEESLTRDFKEFEFKERLIPLYYMEFYLEGTKDTKDQWGLLNDLPVRDLFKTAAQCLYSHSEEFFKINSSMPFVDYLIDSLSDRKFQLYKRLVPRSLQAVADAFKGIEVTTSTESDYMIIKSLKSDFRFGV
jgi:hypothetical protein